MTALHAAAGLAFLAALGHSFLSERLFLAPLRREAHAQGVFAEDRTRRLASAMFHLASVCWAGMALNMLLLEPSGAGYGATLLFYAFVYALSGVGNFWAVRRIHPGGVLLLTASVLVLVGLSS